MRKVFLMAIACLAVPAARAATETYKIDPAHSEVGFKIRHFFSRTPGRFAKYAGTVRVDPKNFTAGSVSVDIEAASIDTANADRDKHLRSPDFFDVAKHPHLTFRSRQVKEKGKNRLEVLGDLTIRGVTKPVTLEVSVMGFGPDAWGGYRAGFEASAKVNRKDFGIVWNKALDTGGFVLGDDVDITLLIEGIRENPETTAPAAAKKN